LKEKTWSQFFIVDDFNRSRSLETIYAVMQITLVSLNIWLFKLNLINLFRTLSQKSVFKVQRLLLLLILTTKYKFLISQLNIIRSQHILSLNEIWYIHNIRLSIYLIWDDIYLIENWHWVCIDLSEDIFHEKLLLVYHIYRTIMRLKRDPIDNQIDYILSIRKCSEDTIICIKR